jgi:hypothetical protein
VIGTNVMSSELLLTRARDASRPGPGPAGGTDVQQGIPAPCGPENPPLLGYSSTSLMTP